MSYILITCLYRCAKARKSRNEIKLLQTQGGKWTTDTDEIKNIIVTHFKQIFKCDEDPVSWWENPSQLHDLTAKLSQEHRQILQQDFTPADVHKAVFQLGGLKAPGPDGIPAVFYHKAWDVVGKDITDAVLHFLILDTSCESGITLLLH